jgi:HEAT repeat protein
MRSCPGGRQTERPDNDIEGNIMKVPGRRSFIYALTFLVLGAASPAWAKEKSEDELIAELASPKEAVVHKALLDLEKQYPTGTKALPTIKKLLADPRPAVKRKAARVLGVMHAEVDGTDLKNICTLLKAGDPQEVMDGLKALRGLKAESTVPEITPLLQNAHAGIVRDACRTLAVLGNKSTIPLLEPLAKSADPKIQKDAQDAIHDLQGKS